MEIKVNDLFEINIGTQLPRIREVMAKDVPAYKIYANENFLKDTFKNTGNGEIKTLRTPDYVETVQQGDLIYSIIQSKAGVVSAEHDGMLLTSNYVKLIPKQPIDIEYARFFFNDSKSMHHQFVIESQGSLIAKLTVSQLRELKFEIPDRDVQTVIGELYVALKTKQLEVEKERKFEQTLIIERIERKLKENR